jgi:heme oxygenase (biliverdin-IX-beta and delta-forming)
LRGAGVNTVGTALVPCVQQRGQRPETSSATSATDMMQQLEPKLGGGAASAVAVELSARAALRNATRDIHDRLHGQMLFRQLLEETITRSAYGALLSRLYGFHQGIETALDAQAGLRSKVSMNGRHRVHLLVSDLKTLGQCDEGISSLPVVAAPPDLDKLGRFLGCLYVREGATLGGRVLAGKLGHLLGPGHGGRRFFAGPDRDSELWRACCSAIEQPMESAERNAMIAAARETFEIFERWMSLLDFRAPAGAESQ